MKWLICIDTVIFGFPKHHTLVIAEPCEWIRSLKIHSTEGRGKIGLISGCDGPNVVSALNELQKLANLKLFFKLLAETINWSTLRIYALISDFGIDGNESIAF